MSFITRNSLNTNRIADGILLLIIWGCHLIAFTPSVISSVDTDGQNPSVYTDEIMNGMLRILKKRAVR